tara:strand:- start:45 stop:743 length:699 start_codon:yes stop_codon:yes gene_type:complete
MLEENLLYKNLSIIKNKIKQASKKINKKPQSINIIAVTKNFPLQSWNMAIQNNLYMIGESKIQETEQKAKMFIKKNVEFHFIGHLQSNKVKKAINLFDYIQTVDTFKLINKISKTAKELNKQQKIFIQVNIANDIKKYGFKEKEILKAAEETIKHSNIILSGIMTIPPKGISNKELQKIYEKTRVLKEKIETTIDPNCKYLSMGMSRDYELAIMQGATHVRLGTALFGKRKL